MSTTSTSTSSSSAFYIADRRALQNLSIFGSSSSRADDDHSNTASLLNATRGVVRYPMTLEESIPSDLLLLIFACLDGYSIGNCARVCHRWRDCAMEPVVFERLCKAEFRNEAHAITCNRVKYGNNWRTMWLKHTRLRFDGVFVLTLRHWTPGTWENGYKPIEHVYYRYMRFHRTNNRVLYTLSTKPPHRVLPLLANSSPEPGGAVDIAIGHYRRRNSLLNVIVYLKHMIAGFKLRIRTSTPGAFDLLEMKEHVELTQDLHPVLQFAVPSTLFCWRPFRTLSQEGE